jgi:GH25 family lysozyme M1 (1,4-beta-N-acetylmuramidase)
MKGFTRKSKKKVQSTQPEENFFWGDGDWGEDEDEEVSQEAPAYAEGADSEEFAYEEEDELEAMEYASEDDSEGLGYVGEADSEGMEYAEEADAEGMEYASEADSEGLEYAEEADVEGLEYAEEADSEGMEYAGENDSEGLEYADEDDSEGLEYSGVYEGDSGYFEQATLYEEENSSWDGEYEEDPGYVLEEGEVEDQRRAYEEGYTYDDLEEEIPTANLFAKLVQSIRSMGIADMVLLAAGVCILTVGIITGISILNAKMATQQIEDFITVGGELADIHVIGEEGLVAIADAKMAKIAAANAVAEMEESEEESQEEGYEEEEYNRHITVTMNMVSIQKDLKIKFVNKDNDKLVANVPFHVQVTAPSGDTLDWTDDDMDGIIYKKDLEPGTYQIKMLPLVENSADYTLPENTVSTEVKKEVVYEKVDVSNEIKKESEVNVAKEDTEKKEIPVESELKDTVPWVESTAVTTTYVEVAKANIPDPLAMVLNGKFIRLASVAASAAASQTPFTGIISESTRSLGVGESFTLTVTTQDGGTVGNMQWASDNPAVAAVVKGGLETQAIVTAVSTGTAVISYSASVSTVSGGDLVPANTITGSCTITVAHGAVSLTVNPASLTLGKETNSSVKATPTGFAPDRALTYTATTSQAGVATATAAVDGTVTITAVAPGDATITVEAYYSDAPSLIKGTATVAVKVIDKKVLTLDRTALTVYLETAGKLTATVANAVLTDTAVTAVSSDTNVAEVSVSGKEISIAPKAVGSTTVTVSYTENGETVQAACAVTVKANPKTDTTSLLLDAAGNQLYVFENQEYREARYADYFTAVQFFVKGDAKYTGWQTLNGNVYFFDASGKKVTGEQVIQGAKYNFASDGALVMGSGTAGIDVSKWNGSIDWNAVKNSGISYVIIRCGYRGSSAGALIEDPKYRSNIKGATAAGLKVGVYFFTQAVDVNEAVMEASMVLDLIGGYKISYPVFLDVEASGGRGDAIDQATRTAVCKAFCETIKANGYTPGIYANKTWLTSKIDAGSLSAYKIWLAQYASAPSYSGRYDIWQYKSNGKVSGIGGDVDLNTSYLGY